MQTVSALEEARAALHAGATELRSPPYAACYAGVNYYRAFVQQLRSEFPQTAFRFFLCCGDNPAIAHDALRLGFREVICDCSEEMRATLQAIAVTQGATLLDPSKMHAIPE